MKKIIIFLLIFAVCGNVFGQKSAVTSHTALTLPKGRLDFGLLHPIVVGITDSVDLVTHPLPDILFPNVGVKVNWANIGDLRTRGDRLSLDVQGKGDTEKEDYVVIPMSQEPVIREWLKHRLTFVDSSAGAPLFVSRPLSHSRFLSSTTVLSQRRRNRRRSSLL